ncbi:MULTISPECIES: phenylacetaldoxime dehydratase family protein [unclassified Sphingomonas]|uniref:phenylacetaldoxime dehydratase family protein n=1 Tax=unclassified Sphingomonas TaxID=196159 RepID=UPI0006F61BEF|nr:MULTISPECIES: phenylacetaldoxime dehydratase family protein [unclassified Sphingomonas]KQX18732.1 phenylacetaldoxime dehydratase [Sphingomonas sp. Root1294]KQY71944.1 phenylacetaldoxime dehydratase [Sphingomonas sp. Root50]KRB94791.1 phenylacetaldoxime dehydratase [Sphingomonas sp. Root720]
MDSSITPHLACARSRQRRIADDYAPPYPAWSARIDPAVERVVMANYGVQWRNPADALRALAHARDLHATLDATSGARHVDLARYVDEAGYDTLVVQPYWTDPSAFRRWETRDEVAALRSAETGLGHFREILTPTVDRLETLYSTEDEMEGIGRALATRSPPVQEHAYWGSARDRFPIAQTDALAPGGQLGFTVASSGHVTVGGHANIAIIRSGQDWGPTSGEERRLYLEEIEPVLRAGMDFLRDRGGECGCYVNRYMRIVDLDGTPQEKSFGWSYWRSLADMEGWSEGHPTHLAIFGTFMKTVQALNFDLKLRLWHEVYAVTPEQQYYDYRNCHAETGFLKQLPR